MTLVSCNLVHVTLKVVRVEIPAVCFCVKYHTARLPDPIRADQTRQRETCALLPLKQQTLLP